MSHGHGGGQPFEAQCRSTESAPQALILAAGRGQRLGSRVAEFPKCLLSVGGRTLLEHQMAMLRAAGVRDVAIVTGYQRRAVAHVVPGSTQLIHNAHWASTNSLYSFWLARHWISRDVIVLNCDVLFDPRVLDSVLLSGHSSFAYDSKSGTEAEHMKVQLQNGQLFSMCKSLASEAVHGENVGLLYFSEADGKELVTQAELAIDCDGQNSWLASAVQRLCRRRSIAGVDIRGLKWTEIDFEADLLAARRVVWPSENRNAFPARLRAMAVG